MLATLLAALLFGQIQTAKAPNIILIVTDDLGARDLGFTGSTFHKTPHLDKLASESAVFTKAYSACPVCSPSRAGILTGQNPARIHVTDWIPGQPSKPSQPLNRPDDLQALPKGVVTLPKLLRERGYATFHVGKWHLGGNGSLPTDHGFDVNIAGDQAGSPRSYFAPYQSGNATFMPGLEKAPQGEYLTDRLNAESSRLIKKHITLDNSRPFFLYLSHFAPHTPLKAQDHLIAKFPGKPTPGRQSNSIYAAMIAAIDDGVGRLRETLEQLGIDKETIIVFTSDNGGLCTTEGPNTPPTYNGPLREGKGYLYEGGIRVPLLIHAPKQGKPLQNNQPVWGPDLTPTLAQLAGIKNVPSAVDGISLVGSLQGVKEESTSRNLVWHYPHYSNQGGRPGGVWRDGPWKLIEFYDSGRKELFQLEKDPGESRNLALDEPKRVEAMAARLKAWQSEAKVQMMRPNPNYLPNPAAKNGIITLHGKTAEVTGAMLRFEPLPHKQTLGFWVVKEDAAWWEFTVDKPGEFQVEILQGCGNGSGGSVLEISIGGESLKHKVVETGGFQEFRPFVVGNIKLETQGRKRLDLKALSKPGPAVGDVRQIRLIPR